MRSSLAKFLLPAFHRSPRHTLPRRIAANFIVNFSRPSASLHPVPFFPTRCLSTNPVKGEALADDPTIVAAKSSLEEAKAYLAELEEKRDLAKQERDLAKQERDLAEKKWLDNTKPERNDFFQRQLNDAQSAFNNAENAVVDAQSAISDAQSAVSDAQSTVNKILGSLAGNGNGNNNGTTWERVEHMDVYAAELLKAHRAAAELEEVEVNSGKELAPGTLSSCGNVEHLGAGVFLEPNTPPIDPDSAGRGGPATLTRRETRFMARASVDAVLDKRSNGKAVVVGQPGTGKSRGGITATIQELMFRGYNVLRVGYKDGKVYHFKPGDDSEQYTVRLLEGDISQWANSRPAKDPNTVAVIDPPEKTSDYRDYAPCKIIKYASNNSQNHFRNIHKDGVLLITAMPTAAETAAAAQYLWNPNTTPKPGDLVDPPLEEKVEEVLRRAGLVGHCWRQLFSWTDFHEQVAHIREEAETKAVAFTPAQLQKFYLGRITAGVEVHTADASSRMFFLNPVNIDLSPAADWTSRRSGVVGVSLVLNPLASATLSDELNNIVSHWSGIKKATEFEDLCFSILRRGVQTEFLKMPASSQMRPATQEETFDLLKMVNCDDGKIVQAPANFPVVDFFTCARNLFNAKVGDNAVTTSSSAFITFLEKSGIASVVDGRLCLSNASFRATLTFLRNSDNGTHSLKRSNASGSPANDEVNEFFEKIFTVKFVNVCDIPKAEGRFVDRLLQHYGFSTIASSDVEDTVGDDTNDE